jgi:hypothetical protein
VATDYEGLGSPGLHPYNVGVSAGRSMLDAGRAARRIPGVYAGPTTAALGFSQGGHAAIFATEIAPTWTPEQAISATLLAAPGSEIVDYVRLGVADPALAAGAVATLAGLAAADPAAAAALPGVLTDAGMQLAGLLGERCFADEVAMPGGDLLAGDPTTVEPFASLIDAQTPGRVAVTTPYLIVQSTSDTNVPVAWSDALVARLCAAGNQVSRQLVDETPHGATLSLALRDGLPWVTGVLGGAPPATASACTG